MTILDTLLLRRTRRRDDLRHLDDHLLRDIGFDGYMFGRAANDHTFARLQDRRR